jgi:hypothetical protein
MTEAYANVDLTVTIRKICVVSPLGVNDAFDNLSNGNIMRGVHVSTEGRQVCVWGGQWEHPVLLETYSRRV